MQLCCIISEVQEENEDILPAPHLMAEGDHHLINDTGSPLIANYIIPSSLAVRRLN